VARIISAHYFACARNGLIMFKAVLDVRNCCKLEIFHNISANNLINIGADLKANLATAGNDKRVVGKIASTAGPDPHDMAGIKRG
jgi:hypothetical protein